MTDRTARVIAMIAQKGGVGKSTLTINLAVAAAQNGERVAIVDLDPQGSVEYWGKLRGETYAELPEIAILPMKPATFGQSLKEARAAGFDAIFVDTPPKAGEFARRVAEEADLVLIPCGASALDIQAIAESMNLADRTKRPACVIMNNCPPVGAIAEDAAAYIETELNFPVAPEIICTRIAFKKAYIEGRGVVEWEKNGKAAQEVSSLASWIDTVLTLSNSQQDISEGR